MHRDPGSTPAAEFALAGTVTATPAYPGPQRIDGPRADRPVSGATVTLTAGGTVVATAITDGAGRFSFTVTPGEYDITATDTGYRRPAGQHVAVAGPTTVALVVDSGMR